MLPPINPQRIRVIYLFLLVLTFLHLYMNSRYFMISLASNRHIYFTNLSHHQYSRGIRTKIFLQNVFVRNDSRALQNATQPNYSSKMLRPRYLINRPSLCSGVRNLTFLVVVHTAIENFPKRHGIRHTWANPKHYKAFTMRTVYFVGRTQNQSLQALIDSESLKHQDIIQGDFIDAYRNMTYKGLSVLNWILEFCNQAKLIIKVDDDVFVNMFTVFQSYLPVLSTKTRQIMCEVVLNGRIRRDISEKWAVSLEEFSGRNFYPTYCSGYLVLLTPDLVNMMLDKVKSYSFFWIDDVYLFGLLTETLNVRWHDIKARTAWSIDGCLSSFMRKTQSYIPADCCLGVTGWEEMFRIWITALRYLPESNRTILS